MAELVERFINKEVLDHNAVFLKVRKTSINTLPFKVKLNRK